MSVPRIIKVSVHQDPDCLDPTKRDFEWSIYTFSNRRNHLITDVEDSRFLNDEEQPHSEIADLLTKGLAYWIEYEDHLPVAYFTNDDARCRDGIVIWEHSPESLGLKTPAERLESAEIALVEYSKWANGDCYGYHIQVLQSTTPEYDPDVDLDNGAYWTDADDSCSGLIGSEYAAEEIKRAMESYKGYRVVYRGDAAHIL